MNCFSTVSVDSLYSCLTFVGHGLRQCNQQCSHIPSKTTNSVLLHKLSLFTTFVSLCFPFKTSTHWHHYVILQSCEIFWVSMFPEVKAPLIFYINNGVDQQLVHLKALMGVKLSLLNYQHKTWATALKNNFKKNKDAKLCMLPRCISATSLSWKLL